MPLPKTFTAGERLFANDLNEALEYLDDKSAGATGAGDDRVFWENDQSVTTSYEITAGQNAMTAGPVTIQSGVTVTVPSGSEWTIV